MLLEIYYRFVDNFQNIIHIIWKEQMIVGLPLKL